MTERERLIKLIEQCSCHYSPPCTGECCECHNVEMYDRNIEHIADHLLANGVIVPPCKVGDMVYRIGKGNEIIKALVADWKKEAAGDWLFRAFYSVNGSSVTILFSDRNIGKTVFLTREEAEKALEEMSKI